MAFHDPAQVHHMETAVLEAREQLDQEKRFSCSSTCPFLNHEFTELDAAQRSKTTVKLCGLTILYTIVMIVEIFGGMKANSLAILTDAAHLLSDIAGFSISIFTVWASGWEATTQQSFGYGRLEVVGALISVQLIWLVSATLIYEAIKRLLTKNTTVDGTLMFAISALGFVLNSVMVLWLGHSHSNHDCHSDHHSCKNKDHTQEMEERLPQRNGEESVKLVAMDPARKTETTNINIQGAYLHLVTDLIQSLGVMIAGSIIWLKPSWLVVDLVCTLVFSVVALATTMPMLKNVFGILMERAPCEIDAAALANGLKHIRGVCDVHDLHVWAITSGKHVLACHVRIEPGLCQNEILDTVTRYCEGTFGIPHVTIQIEQEL
ncbi:metal tolerance protein B [Dorcoceras hygrometricum]|uniref:Metal tolerance protein B n=1 Tax=Dorcoceras hygrometricum TaxID=472368 RepID=A0A2Z7CQH6_9LAMI|nr:metal tolerance protein B [Dorcoceras hygrometricum]